MRVCHFPNKYTFHLIRKNIVSILLLLRVIMGDIVKSSIVKNISGVLKSVIL